MTTFDWTKLQRVADAMARDAVTRRAAVTVVNRRWPGRGTELAETFTLIAAAQAGSEAALYEVRVTAEAAAAGHAWAVQDLTLYRVVNAALKAVALQAEVTRLALAETQSSGNEPYELLR